MSTAVDTDGGCCGSDYFVAAGHKASTLYNETSEEWADEDDDDDDDDDGASFSGNYLGLGKVPKGKPCFFLGVWIQWPVPLLCLLWDLQLLLLGMGYGMHSLPIVCAEDAYC